MREYLAKQAHCPLVYIDATGFSLSTCRNYGWAKSGLRVHGLQQANQRPRTRLIGGYLNQRFIAPMLFEGTCNTEVFNRKHPPSTVLTDCLDIFKALTSYSKVTTQPHD